MIVKRGETTVSSRLAFGLAVTSFVIVSTRPPKKFCRKVRGS